MRDTATIAFIEKIYTYLMILSLFWRIRKNVYANACSLQIISHLDSQSKFQMLNLFSGRHIGVPTNMAFPYWALKISAKHFDEYLTFEKTHRFQTWKSVFLLYFM